jgi:hypothetical protein
MTLLEVLISMSVLLLGLLGVAALIPIGKVALSETNKADRAGACGRAALRDVRVRGMLDTSNWSAVPTGNAFVIDPLGWARFASGTTTDYFGGTTSGTVSMTVQRINLTNVSAADDVFRWHDDLTFAVPENPSERPTLPKDAAGNVLTGAYDGSFSWFVTIVPQVVVDTAGTRFTTNQSTVSVIVCWRREFNSAENDPNAGETSVNVVCDSSPAYGGMGIEYSTEDSKEVVPKENQWVLLTSTSNGGQASWYRVVAAAIGDDPDRAKRVTRVSLVGPDWYGGQGGTIGTPPTPDGTIKMIVVKGAVGVYTTTVKLDDDMVW